MTKDITELYQKLGDSTSQLLGECLCELISNPIPSIMKFKDRFKDLIDNFNYFIELRELPENDDVISDEKLADSIILMNEVERLVNKLSNEN